MYNFLISAVDYGNSERHVVEYMDQLIQRLASEHTVYVLVPKKVEKHFTELGPNIHVIRSSFISGRGVAGFLYHCFYLPFRLNFNKFDCVILPNAGVSMFWRCPVFTVGVMHRAGNMNVVGRGTFLRRFMSKRFSRHCLMQNNYVMCANATTEKYVDSFFSIPENKLVLNYSGYNVEKYNKRVIVDRGAIKARYGLKSNFILCHADVVYPENNHINLLKAFDKLPDFVKEECDLVLVGKRGRGSDVVTNYAKHSTYSHNIIFIEDFPDKNFPALYKMATVYLHLFDKEQYVERIIYAMSCGTPVIAPRSAFFKEIGGGAVHLYHPDNFDDIAMHLEAVVGYPQEQEDMAARGLYVVENYDWNQNLKELIGLYNESCDNERAEMFRELRSLNYKTDQPLSKCWRPFISLIWSFLAYFGESVVSLLLFFAVSLPLLACFSLRKLILRKNIFSIKYVYGARREHAEFAYFNCRSRFLSVAWLFYYVLRNRIALIGVSLKPVVSGEEEAMPAYRYNDKPGIISPAFIDEARGDENAWESEWSYIYKKRWWTNAVILFRAMPAFVANMRNDAGARTVDIIGVPVSTLSEDELVEMVLSAINTGTTSVISFADCQQLQMISRDDYLRSCLGKGDSVLIPEDMSILSVAAFLRRPATEVLTAVDVARRLFSCATSKGLKVLLLGENLGVTVKMAARISNQFPGLDVYAETFTPDIAQRDINTLVDIVHEVKPDITFMPSGTIEQEVLIRDLAGRCHCNVFLAVASLFEICSGNESEVPAPFRKAGMSWIIRLARDKNIVRHCLKPLWFVVAGCVRALRGT